MPTSPSSSERRGLAKRRHPRWTSPRCTSTSYSARCVANGGTIRSTLTSGVAGGRRSVWVVPIRRSRRCAGPCVKCDLCLLSTTSVTKSGSKKGSNPRPRGPKSDLHRFRSQLVVSLGNSRDRFLTSRGQLQTSKGRFRRSRS
jgi:hypothetical protein